MINGIGVVLALSKKSIANFLTGALSNIFAESLRELPKLFLKHVTQRIGIIAVVCDLQLLILSL